MIQRSVATQIIVIQLNLVATQCGDKANDFVIELESNNVSLKVKSNVGESQCILKD